MRLPTEEKEVRRPYELGCNEVVVSHFRRRRDARVVEEARLESV